MSEYSGFEPDFIETDEEESLDEYAHQVALSLSATDETSFQTSLRRRSKRVSGWLVGVVIGILVGLWMLPPVRYTLGSQLDFSLALDSLPWMRPFSAQTNLKEAKHLEDVAHRLPDDYLLQVGRATAFVEEGGVRATPPDEVGHSDDMEDLSDHTLIRLTRVAHNFPIAAGAQAHLVRYMMVDRVRILRAELTPRSEPPSPPLSSSASVQQPPQNSNARTGQSLPPFGRVPAVNRSWPTATLNNPQPGHPAPVSVAPPRTIPPRFTDIKLTLWALKNGERLDPSNAFWPAMRAITYYASGRDQLALAALKDASDRPHWDSYLYEEVLGQWRLYSVAYGDHGAAQQIGPLSLIAFPHLQQLRHMAEMARWQADRAAARGDVNRAIQIRFYVRKLGRLLRDSATWAYEALFGTDLVLIAGSDSNPAFQETTISTVEEWKRQASGYLAFLKKHNKLSESTVLETDVEDCCRLRAKVNIARADASYPGIPPGIPLIALFGNWMAGVALLQQFLMMCVGVVIALLWQLLHRRSSRYSRLSRVLFWSLLFAIPLGIGLLLFSSLPSSRLSSLFFACVAIMIVMLANGGQNLWWRFRRSRAPLNESSTAEASDIEDRDVEDLDAGDSNRVDTASVERRWSRGTLVRFLVAIVVPGIAQLWLFLPFLSGLHPVALLLTSLIGIDPPSSPLHALMVGYLACALPFLLVITLTLWALRRSVPVAHAVAYGLRRLFLPTLIGTCVVYLLLLNATLRLDSEASHAINEAARDDLHWVLTHSEDGP